MTTDEIKDSNASSTADEIKGTLKAAASDAVDRLPEVASATRSALVEVDRQVQAGSDEMLTVGTALSFGMAAGLLLAGANRVLVLSALLPAVMLGLTLLDRSSRSRTAAKTTGSNGRSRLQGA